MTEDQTEPVTDTTYSKMPAKEHGPGHRDFAQCGSALCQMRTRMAARTVRPAAARPTVQPNDLELLMPKATPAPGRTLRTTTDRFLILIDPIDPGAAPCGLHRSSWTH